MRTLHQQTTKVSECEFKNALLLLKFNLPTNFYFFATDIATIERDLKIVFGFVHPTEVH